MRIMIDIGHPAHVHLFRHFALQMTEKGHHVFFTTREKEVTIQLLLHYRFDYISFGKPYKSTAGKLFGMVAFDARLLKAALAFKPDIFLSCGSIYAAQVSALLRKPHITFEDTGNMEQIRLYRPFTDAILVSTSFKKDLGKRMLRYKGYHELAYLHPEYFKPDPGILDLLKIEKDTPYTIIRFVSWGASHDVGQTGFSLEHKIEIARTLSQKTRVFISSELGAEDLPAGLGKYAINIPPERMHDALAFASLYIGEGATMASECAVLGTPSIYVNTITAGSLEEQERYGLLFGFRDSRGVLEKAVELLRTPNLRDLWQERRQKMLSEKSDVTAFMIRFVENYPESLNTLIKKNSHQDTKAQRN